MTLQQLRYVTAAAGTISHAVQQRCTGLYMTKQAGNRSYIHVLCNQQAGVRMPLRYNYDKPEKPRRIKGFEVFSLIFSSFSKPKNHTEISRIAGGVSLTTNE